MKIGKDIIQNRLREHFKWISVPVDADVEASPVNGTWYEKQEVEL